MYYLRLKDDPILRKVSRPVGDSDFCGLNKLIPAMRDIMVKNLGLGIAAPQVGVLLRVILVSSIKYPNPIVMINPVIIDTWGAHRTSEGCLSFPEEFVDVVRPDGLKVIYQDESGDLHTLSTHDKVLTQCIVHEVAHLDGRLLGEF